MGKVFISHRSHDYSKAVDLKRFLLSNAICSEVVLWENETLCRNYEQLTVHEYFEALSKLKTSMLGCDHFLYINSPDYFNGYFTSAEITIWRWIKEDPVIQCMDICEGGYCSRAISVGKMSSREKHKLSFSSFLMKPDPVHDMEHGFSKDSWGKYAKDCFLVGCCSCGEYYLIGYNKMKEYIASNEAVLCPNCKRYHCRFVRHQYSDSYFNYRHPIIMRPVPHTVHDLKPLSVDDILILLGAKHLPDRFKLVVSPKDKLMSDNKKNFITSCKFIGRLSIMALLAVKVFDRNK